jgi:hypothetical protein
LKMTDKMKGPAEIVNYLSFVAANLVYDLASTFPNREVYEPLEGFAVALQREIVQKGAIYIGATDELR